MDLCVFPPQLHHQFAASSWTTKSLRCTNLFWHRIMIWEIRHQPQGPHRIVEGRDIPSPLPTPLHVCPPLPNSPQERCNQSPQATCLVLAAVVYQKVIVYEWCWLFNPKLLKAKGIRRARDPPAAWTALGSWFSPLPAATSAWGCWSRDFREHWGHHTLALNLREVHKSNFYQSHKVWLCY